MHAGMRVRFGGDDRQFLATVAVEDPGVEGLLDHPALRFQQAHRRGDDAPQRRHPEIVLEAEPRELVHRVGMPHDDLGAILCHPPVEFAQAVG